MIILYHGATPNAQARTTGLAAAPPQVRAPSVNYFNGKLLRCPMCRIEHEPKTGIGESSCCLCALSRDDEPKEPEVEIGGNMHVPMDGDHPHVFCGNCLEKMRANA